MIYNERQLKITAAELRKLKDAKQALEETESNRQSWLVEAQHRALESQIEDLERQISDYQMLKEGKVSYAESAWDQKVRDAIEVKDE